MRDEKNRRIVNNRRRKGWGTKISCKKNGKFLVKVTRNQKIDKNEGLAQMTKKVRGEWGEEKLLALL